MSKLNLLVVCLSLSACWLSVVLGPRWLFTSMNRGRLWELRDKVVDQRRYGHLPRSREVDMLIGDIERGIVLTSFITPLNVWRISRARARIVSSGLEDASAMHDRRPLSGGSLQDCQRYDSAYDKLDRLLVRQLFTGSWQGLLLTVWLLLRAIGDGVSLRWASPVGSLSSAAEVVVDFGRWSIRMSERSTPGKRLAEAEENIERIRSDERVVSRRYAGLCVG